VENSTERIAIPCLLRIYTYIRSRKTSERFSPTRRIELVRWMVQLQAGPFFFKKINFLAGHSVISVSDCHHVNGNGQTEYPWNG
ncbi:MAG: hypothetical protein OEQ39_25955, partial [Gammaproteobacteria bacterium]|nr:hypothetical protein [Gammaproteobacteria bacterium]